MYESIAILRSTTFALDDELNEVAVYNDREVFVKPRSVYANDFYNAARAGLKPELVLVLSNPEDYEGETTAIYGGKVYTVIRVYQRPEKDAVELTLEERVGNEQES